MKQFLVKLLFFIFLTALTFQFLYQKSPSIFSLRTFFNFVLNMTGDDNNYRNDNGERIINKNNNIGFNSHIDFYKDSIMPNDIAIIGDSFIVSYQTGVYNSISFFLDEKLTNGKVYNFGVIGGNINDYYKIYEQYNLNGFKKVFVMITGANDLMYAERYKKNSQSPAIDFKLITLLGQKIRQKRRFSKPNYKLINNSYQNTVLILHDGLKTDLLRQHGIQLDIIEINLGLEFRLPDNHYTASGNKLIAQQLFDYLSKN